MSKYKLKTDTTDAWTAEELCDIINNTADLVTWPVELKQPLARGSLVFRDRGSTDKKVDAISVLTGGGVNVQAMSKADMIIYTPDGLLEVVPIVKFNDKFDKV